jgi:hypothetical protein
MITFACDLLGSVCAVRHGGDNIYTVKLASAFSGFNLFTPQGAPVFALKMLVYAAFIDIYALFFRYFPNPF